MSVSVQVTMDAASPGALARFWAFALGYQEDPPPAGYESWADWAVANGIPEERWDDAAGIRDPDGTGPRVFFQKVPESKTTKNRVHLDVNVGRGIDDNDDRWRAVLAHAEALTAEGATVVEERSEYGSHWMVMTDPEGNEFCLQ